MRFLNLVEPRDSIVKRRLNAWRNASFLRYCSSSSCITGRNIIDRRRVKFKIKTVWARNLGVHTHTHTHKPLGSARKKPIYIVYAFH